MNERIPLDPVGEDPVRAERRDAVANRERILTIAADLFARHGVAAVHMADIAKAAAVGKGTLYRRFANKGELCLALIDDKFREFQNIMLDRFRQMTAAGVSNLGQLEQFLAALVYFTDAHIQYLCEIQQLVTEPPQDFGRPHYWNEMTIQGLLKQAVAAGEVASTIDTGLVAALLLASLNAANFRYLRYAREYELEQICAGLSYIVGNLLDADS